MNKNELITLVSKKTALPKTKIAEVLESTLEEIAGSLEKGEGISFLGFGSFVAKEKSARKGRNPRTGEEITIPKRTVPEFRASSKLKERVNK